MLELDIDPPMDIRIQQEFLLMQATQKKALHKKQSTYQIKIIAITEPCLHILSAWKVNEGQ